MAKLRGEEIIARGFQNEGVDTFFFMMGGPTSGTAGACLELGMQGIYVRHEQTAAMAAHAYARVTGRPGICITPSGPGTANAVTGLGRQTVGGQHESRTGDEPRGGPGQAAAVSISGSVEEPRRC